ncbi:MAG TPA: transposase [Drouetiella sp.]
MIIRKGYRFKLSPTVAQAELFAQFSGTTRFVWNRALDLQKKAFGSKQKFLNYSELCKRLVNWKSEFAFLKEVHSQPLQQSLKDLSRAWSEGVTGVKGLPKFKKKGKHDTFRFPQGVKIDNKRIYLPKIGWVKFRKSQEIEGTIKNVTLTRYLGSWFVSIQVEMDATEPVHPSMTEIGIDMGVVRFATISDGTFLAPINSFKRAKEKLAKAQKKLSKKQKFSSNWKKQLSKVQRIHAKVANVRKDYLHKHTTDISKNHAVIVLEDLKVKNMSATAKGTIEDPGKNVKAKSGLNRAILDQSWYEFRRQLEYKQTWRGGKVIAVNPAFTSLGCSVCHNKDKKNREEQAIFKCVACGYEDHADVNAAKNILAAGQAVRACGDIKRVAA